MQEHLEHCKSCNVDVIPDVRPNQKHEYGYWCPKCGKWIRWPKKDHSENNNRESKHRELVKKYSKGFCEICMTKEQYLPAPQTLEAHHIEKYEHGGSSERENIMILCTWCHKQVEQIRTYKSHFLKVIETFK